MKLILGCVRLHPLWSFLNYRNRLENITKNPYLRTLYNFVQQNNDCVRFREKMDATYYFSGFSPLQDYNIEFIFREMLALNGVMENERIAAVSWIVGIAIFIICFFKSFDAYMLLPIYKFQRAFEKVNPIPSAACPFRNPDRKIVYTSVDTSELFNLPEEDGETESQRTSTGEDASYQKKIVPWEIMLQTDIDLSRELVQKKVGCHNNYLCCLVVQAVNVIHFCLSTWFYLATAKQSRCSGQFVG